MYLVGGPFAAAANPSLFLELMGKMRETGTDERLAAWVEERHTSVRRLIDLMADVAVEQPQADFAERRSGERREELSAATKRGAVELYIRGAEPDVISAIFDVPEDRVSNYIFERRTTDTGRERDVLRRYFDGEPVTSIAQALNLTRAGVYKILDRAGEDPKMVRRTGVADADEIVRLRNQGATYGQIREATGATTNQIRMALRRRKNQVNNYGTSQEASA